MKESQREWKGAAFEGMVWFYAPGSDASVSGNPSVFGSQESAEDLIICHIIHQSSASRADSSGPAEKESPASISTGGWCAKRGTFTFTRFR